MSDNEAGGVCDGGVRLWKWVPKLVVVFCASLVDRGGILDKIFNLKPRIAFQHHHISDPGDKPFRRVTLLLHSSGTKAKISIYVQMYRYSIEYTSYIHTISSYKVLHPLLIFDLHGYLYMYPGGGNCKRI